MYQPRPYNLYLFMQGAIALVMQMIFTASMVYQVTVVQLSPLQLVLVGTALEATVFLFEVPTGIVADAYSRRLSIILGVALIGFGFLLEGSIPLFSAVLIAQFLWGIGYTFTSGATQAWISDEIGEDRVGAAFLRAAQIENIGGLVGIALGAVVGSLMINLPIVAGGGALLVLAFVLGLSMQETGFKPIPRENRNSLQHMTLIFEQGIAMVRKRPALLTILAGTAIHGAFSEGFDRLWTAHMLQDVALPLLGDLQPVAWLGGMRILSSLLGIGAIQLGHRRLDLTRHAEVARTLLLFVSALISVLVIAFALTTNFLLAAAVYCLAQALRKLASPIQDAWVNQRLDSSVRATVISMNSQADAFGQIAGGPAVGTLGSAVSVRAAIAVSGVILLPVLPLYSRTGRRGDKPVV